LDIAEREYLKKCKMQNAKCKMQNAKCKMQNAKCKMQNHTTFSRSLQNASKDRYFARIAKIDICPFRPLSYRISPNSEAWAGGRRRFRSGSYSRHASAAFRRGMPQPSELRSVQKNRVRCCAKSEKYHIFTTTIH